MEGIEYKQNSTNRARVNTVLELM